MNQSLATLFAPHHSTHDSPTLDMDCVYLADPTSNVPLAFGLPSFPYHSDSSADSSDNNSSPPCSPNSFDTSFDTPISSFTNSSISFDNVLSATNTASNVKSEASTGSSKSAGSKVSKPKRAYAKRKAPASPVLPETLSDSADPVTLPATALRELLEEQDLKKQRLARKAELARMSRKRRKTRLVELEEEVAKLHEDIAHLQKQRMHDQELLAKQSQTISEAQWSTSAGTVAESVSSSTELQQLIQQMASATGNEQHVAQLMQSALEVLAQREASAKAHLASLDTSVVSCMPLKFMQWVMSQSDKFYGDPSGLWSSLFQQEVGVSAQQMQDLLNMRAPVRVQQQVSVEVENAMLKLNSLLGQHLAGATSSLAHLRSILTPSQLTKFFSWVERFGPVCVKINV